MSDLHCSDCYPSFVVLTGNEWVCFHCGNHITYVGGGISEF